MKLNKDSLIFFAEAFNQAADDAGFDMEVHITCGRQGWGCIVIARDFDDEKTFVIHNRICVLRGDYRLAKRTPSQLISDILMWYNRIEFGEYYDHAVHKELVKCAEILGVEW